MFKKFSSLFSKVWKLSVFIICIGASSTVMAQQGGTGQTTFETVEVTASNDGTSEVGYVVNILRNYGLWGDKPLIDVPFTINTVTEDYFKNLQLISIGDMLNRLPGVDFSSGYQEHDLADAINVRGFSVAGNSGIKFNGIPLGTPSYGQIVELFQSVDVYSGLTGFLYGTGNVGGTLNYNVKRPYYEFKNSVRVGTVGNEQYFGHIDVGGPILDGKLAYRINLLAQDGETSIKFQEKERQLASIALDWNVTPDLLVQVNASVGKIHIRGRQGTFYFENPSINAFRDGTYYPDLLESYENTTFFTGVTSPPPGLPDPTTPFASKDTFADAKTRFTGANIHYKLNDWISFRAAGVIYIRDMLEVWGNTFFTLNPDVFRADIRARRGYGKSKGAYGYVDVNFQTGPLEHKLTAGANGYYTLINQQTATFQSPNLVPGETNRYMYYYYSGRFSDPSLISNFDLDQYDVLSLLAPRRHHTSDTKNYNLIIGDDIKITDQWSVMLGVNYSTLRTRTFNANTGIRNSQYKSSAWTPTIAVLYKPLPYVTTYASYIESLEAGVNVPATSSYLNAGETLPPFSSSQYEFGVKAKLGGMFLTAAFYQINKALQYADTSRNLYVQDGRQRHRGFEFTARGKLTDDLTLMGGFNITRAKRLKSSNPRLDGLAMRNVPKFSGKIYLEYDIPVIEGLTVTGGINHYGKTYLDDNLRLQIPAFTFGDLGLRYSHSIKENTIIYRLNITNVTNAKYWYGGGGSSHLSLGLPRNIALTAEIQF